MSRVMTMEIDNTSTLDRPFKGISDTQRALACGIREDQGGIEVSHLGMLCEDILGVAGERYRTCLTVLGLPKSQHPTFEVDI